MAITSAGFRLYFSLYSDGFRSTIGPTSNIPNALELGHIRIPPPNDLASKSQLMVRNTYYDCGICLSIKNVNDDYDAITVTATAPSVISPEQQSSYPLISAVPNRPVYVETVDTVTTKSKAWALSETKTEQRGKRHMKEIAQQLSQPPRQFMALTTRAVVFYNKLRPVDVLFKILAKPGRLLIEEQKDYQIFFDRYGKTESCAMCLSVICNTDAQDIVAKATSVFFEFGGDPTSVNSTQTAGNHLGQIIGKTGVTFSGRHDGFLLYFSRMIAPIWKLKVFANW
jgi:nuclear pore complex protein Nup155